MFSDAHIQASNLNLKLAEINKSDTYGALTNYKILPKITLDSLNCWASIADLPNCEGGRKLQYSVATLGFQCY